MCRKNTRKGLSLIIFLLTTEIVGVSDIKGTRPSPVVIPRNKQEYVRMTQHLNCSNGTVPIYLLNGENETFLGCFEDVKITGRYCPELNNGKIQERFNAFCGNFSVTPCVFQYYASESYKYFECFEKHGGVHSPLDMIKEINTLKMKKSELIKQNEELKKERLPESTGYVYQIFSVVTTLVLSFLLIYAFLLGFLIRKFIYREKITYADYLKMLLCAFRSDTCLLSCGEKVENDIRKCSTGKSGEKLHLDNDASDIIGPLNIRNESENETNDIDLYVGEEPISFGKTAVIEDN